MAGFWTFLHSAIACCLQVGVHYDPMIAKVIAKGANRTEALARLHAALSQLQASRFSAFQHPCKSFLTPAAQNIVHILQLAPALPDVA